jgi:hypothetical protein
MRIVKLALLVLLPLPAQAEVFVLMPEPFMGRWAANTAACADPDNDALSLVVEPARLVFPANSPRIWAVIPSSLQRVFVMLNSIAEDIEPPETDNPTEGLEFQLSQDGQTLTTLMHDIAIVSRVRCPATRTTMLLGHLGPAN